MRPEVLFVAGYAAGLLLLAAGLHRLGRVNTSPWTGRVLAGHRRAVQVTPDPVQALTRSDWPHSEVPRLHTGIALVAVAAATLLAGAEIPRHHRPPELLLLAAVAAAAGGAAARLARALTASCQAGGSPRLRTVEPATGKAPDQRPPSRAAGPIDR